MDNVSPISDAKADAPVIASYGAGTNSTAMLIEMVRRGERVDAILFADTGGERPATYGYLRLFSAWLRSQDAPAIQTVRKGGRAETLEQNCLRMHMLPSVAYGHKSCSLKYKAEPQEQWANHWPLARAAWEEGSRVIKCLGFDADEAHRARYDADRKYHWRYPLIEWGFGRDECADVIRSAGLPLPGKSACFFCPNSKPEEILDLPADLLARALALEANAELTTLAGLGRRWSWHDLVRADRAQLRLFDVRGGTSHDMPCACHDGA
jgi:hypothetical protein